MKKKFQSEEEAIEFYEEERRAFHKVVQDVVREFEDEGVVVGCFAVIEIAESDGGKHLAYRTFDVNGEVLKSWTAVGYLESALESVKDQARGTTYAPEDEVDDGCDDDDS